MVVESLSACGYDEPSASPVADERAVDLAWYEKRLFCMVTAEDAFVNFGASRSASSKTIVFDKEMDTRQRADEVVNKILSEPDVDVKCHDF